MSLYKRKDSPFWWVKLSVNGRTVQKSTGTPDRRKAKEVHDRWAAQCWEEAKLGIKLRRYWEEAVLRWLEECTHKKTLETDRFHLRWLQPHLEGMELGAIDRDKIETLVRAGLAEGVKNATVNRRIELLRAILRKACADWEWLDRVPRIRFLKEPKGRVRFLTSEEAQRLLKELPPHLQAMAAFSLCTGLRQANVKQLRWAQVDMQRGFAWIEAHEAKGGKAIPVPLTPDALTILRERVGEHREYVFTYRGEPIRQVGTKAWRAAVSRAGLEDFRWHDLRHTWASWHVQNGTPLYALQELGGWSDTEMVRRYAHLSADHLATYARKMAERVPVQVSSGSYDLATQQKAP